MDGKQILENLEKDREMMNEAVTKLDRPHKDWYDSLAAKYLQNSYTFDDEMVDRVIKDAYDSLFEVPRKELGIILSAMTKALNNGEMQLFRGVESGTHEGRKFKVGWTMNLFTSPIQLKVIFRDAIRNYPQLTLDIKVGAVNEHGEAAVMGFRLISLGQAVSFLTRVSENYEHLS